MSDVEQLKILYESILIQETHGNEEYITPKDIYSFYYATYISQTDPSSLTDKYKSYVITSVLNDIKKKYLSEFKTLIADQIDKYVRRQRTDQDFPSVDLYTQSFSNLLHLMKKTFRSDMSRRNTRWESIVEYLVELEKTNSVPGMIYLIDRINNAVHNTQTQVIDKLRYADGLLTAFDNAHSKRPEFIRALADKDLKSL